MVGVLRCAALAIATLAPVACDLADTVIPETRPLIVVHAVMRPDLPQQYVLVEQTLAGVLPPDREVQPVPPGELQLPVTAARVRVTNLDLSGGPCGDTVEFDAVPLSQPRIPGVYWAPLGCPTTRPGDRLALVVEAPGLGTVTGTTRVPELAGVSLTTPGGTFGPGDTVPFNRDADVLSLAVGARFHRILQLVAYRTGRLPPGLPFAQPDLEEALVLFADSTSVALPGTILHAGGRGTGGPAFRGGSYYALSTAVADANYYDFVRTSSNTITGRGFANHLSGGIGVFGTVVATSYVLKVTADADDPREGTYRLTGILPNAGAPGADIDLFVSLYFAPQTTSGTVSALLEGFWVHRSLETGWWDRQAVTGQRADGRFRGDTLELTIQTAELAMRARPSVLPLTLRGVWSSSGRFSVDVYEPALLGELRIATLAADRQ